MNFSGLFGAVGKLANAGFALAMAALLASGYLAYTNQQRIADNEARVIHTHEVLDGLGDVMAYLTEAESGQRGYIITGERRYVVFHDEALAKVDAMQRRLVDLTADNPPQQARLATLRSQIAARASSLAGGIRARDAQGPEGGREFVARGEGREQMVAVRTTLGDMERVERDLLTQREAESRRSFRTGIATTIVSTALGLGLIVIVYLIAARELATRRRAALDLARANEELEARVQARTADLADANTSLRRSNRELEQFASVASHDLQEPLRKIQAFGDRLSTKFADTLGEQGRDYVERMQASATRMRALIDALLTFSRVTTKAQPFVPVDLDAIARDVAGDLEARIAQSGGQVEVEALPAIDADPLQMHQLLQNLIANALKFQRPGVPPQVRVSGGLRDTDRGPVCELRVADNGIGFDEVYLDRIFEVFQRLHGRQEYEGTGMGLAICRRIVERHGGTITARSIPDQGATFVVTLPATHEDEESR